MIISIFYMLVFPDIYRGSACEHPAGLLRKTTAATAGLSNVHSVNFIRFRNLNFFAFDF